MPFVYKYQQIASRKATLDVNDTIIFSFNRYFYSIKP